MINQYEGPLTSSEVGPAVSASVAGAEEAVEFTLRHDPQDPDSTVQRFLYARSNGLLGIATLTSTAADWDKIDSSASQIWQSLALQAP